MSLTYEENHRRLVNEATKHGLAEPGRGSLQKVDGLMTRLRSRRGMDLPCNSSTSRGERKGQDLSVTEWLDEIARAGMQLRLFYARQ
jgi:hypothetical protein